MSGSLVELIAKGPQDAHLTGKPEVSYFHQAYKRHTNFAFKPVQLDYIGKPQSGAEIAIKIPSKGDLLSYVWLNLNGAHVSDLGFDTIVEFHIGGQLIDRQDLFYISLLWNKFLVDSAAKVPAISPEGDVVTARDHILDGTWLPLHFCFCDSIYLPLIGIQMHEVEIRIKFGSSGTIPSNITVFASYVLLDTDERKFFVEKDHELLIEQVQRITADGNKFDLRLFNHPVKCLLWGIPNDATTHFVTDGAQLYLNGTEVFGALMPDIYFTQVQGYYHCEHASDLLRGSASNLKMYSFAAKVSKHHSTGTCNFSRLDAAAIQFSTVSGGTLNYMYGVNFNILKIKKGLAGLAFQS